MGKRTITTGIRGCCAKTKRRGVERYCAQKPIVSFSGGHSYCYYHNPMAPKKFGEGYSGTRSEPTYELPMERIKMGTVRNQ